MLPPPDTVFDPDALAVLTAAYEKAVREQGGSLHETIAKRIIQLASEGERDPDRLCHGALALSMRKPRSPTRRKTSGDRIGNLPTDKFVPSENIRHCRARLKTEIDPTRRAMLQKVLVEQEDKLGAHDELIADIEREIATSKVLIEEHRVLIATLLREDRSGVEQAKALLDGLVQTQTLHEEYRQKLRVC